MESVIIADFGTTLGKTSERLVVRGPRPRLELIEGGPQLSLPMDLPARPPLRVLTSDGAKAPAAPMPAAKTKDGSPRASRPRPEQVELPLFRISEIIVAAPGVSLSTDLIEACCERGIRLSFLTPAGQPFAALSSPRLTATVLTRRERMAAYGDRHARTRCARSRVGRAHAAGGATRSQPSNGISGGSRRSRVASSHQARRR